MVESPIPGSVRISILSTELSTDIEELLNILKKQVARDDIKILTDTIEVVNCTMIPINIHSKITAISDDIIERAKEQFIEKFESTKRLGCNVTRAWIVAHLFTESVENIDLIEPREDIIIKGNESATLRNFKIERVYSL